MLESFSLNRVGPIPGMLFSTGKRLNVITGDNGLGKSFLLDVIWWAITRSWPEEINPHINSGRKVRPNEGEDSSITLNLRGASGSKVTRKYTFDADKDEWLAPSGRPPKGGLTLYAMVDGSFAVWDPARNYWKDDEQSTEGRPSAYVFTPDEIWNGQGQGTRTTCAGLIADFSNVNFRDKGGKELMEKALELLSPEGELLSFGETTRVGQDDARDIPTIRMPYSEEAGVPIFHASSAIKRILSLAYMLVWAWREHLIASKKRKEEPARRITFLIDEIEAHLHPRWQRTILRSLLNTFSNLMGKPQVKLFMTTHSPMVMASCEDEFSATTDKWFDLDYDRGSGTVQLTTRPFEKRGTADSWLTSYAFDLYEPRSPKAEAAIRHAASLFEADTVTEQQLTEAEEKLAAALDSLDPCWLRWKWLCDRKFNC